MINNVLSGIGENFNSREISVIIWTLVFFVGIFFLLQKSGGLKKSIKIFLEIPKLLLNPKLLIPMIVLWSNVFLVVYVLYRFGVWELADNLKDTIIWFVVVPHSMFFNYKDFLEKGYYWKLLKQLIALSIVVEFIVGLYPFSLTTELILVPIVTFLALFQVLTKSGYGESKNAEVVQRGYKIIDKGINFILMIVGFRIIGHSVSVLMRDTGNFFTVENLISFFLPIILTVLVLPYIYFLSAYGTYEQLFVRFSIQNKYKDKKLVRYAKWRLFRRFRFNAQALNRWSKNNPRLWLEDKKQVRELVES